MASKSIATLKAPLVAAIAAVALAACAFLCVGTSYAADTQNLAASSIDVSTQASATANLKAAQKKYKIPADRVINAKSVKALTAALSEAGSNATASKRYIVHLAPGKYKVKDKVVIPSNVLLVSEAKTTVTPGVSMKDTYMVRVAGSIYGGTFDGAYKASTILRYDETKFAKKNGIIEKAKVKRSAYYGITAIRKATRNAQIVKTKVTNCKASGITALDGAYIKLISGCNISNNVWAGINLSHADAGYIKKCTINNNGDKGVSTNSDPDVGYKQPGCTITSITGCTFKGNKTHGVYLKPKCTLKSFTKNKLINNADGIAAVGKTDAGTTGKSIIKNVKNNTFKGNKESQIKASMKGAKILVGGGNKITKGKRSAVEAHDHGVVIVNGAKNVIKNNTTGLKADLGGNLTIKGKKTVISGNSTTAYCVSNAKIVTKGIKLEGKVYSTSGGKIVQK